MKVVKEVPPMFEEIDREFNCKDLGVIYCWGDTIYNPNDIIIGPALMAHEEIHSNQQEDKVEEWWKAYIADPYFRLEMELPAHYAEWLVEKALSPNRKHRRMMRALVAHKLSSPLYGRIIDTRSVVQIFKSLDAAKKH
jgi:hypothetical protein